MPKPQSLRTLVDQFVSDLSAVVHQQALDTVRAAPYPAAYRVPRALPEVLPWPRLRDAFRLAEVGRGNPELDLAARLPRLGGDSGLGRQ